MTDDEHRDPTDPQNHDEDAGHEEQDGFEFEIDPMDIAPYQPGAPGANDVPQISVPPPAEPAPPLSGLTTTPELPGLDRVIPDAFPSLARDETPPALRATPALPISETFTGEVISTSPSARGPADDAGPPSGGEIPAPPPPPPPTWSDDDLEDLITPSGKRKRKRKRKRDPGYDPDYARSFTWLEAWVQAVTQPNPDAYEELIADPQASQSRAMTWIVVAYGIGLSVLVCGLMMMRGGALVGMLCVMPFVAGIMVVAAIVGYIIHFGVMHIVARILGGTGEFWELFYLGVCYYMPLMIVGSVLNFIPCIGPLVGLAVGLYALYLAIVAVRASHGLEWGRAAVAGLSWMLVGCGCVCCMVFLLVAAGSSSALQNILDDLISPTPGLWWGLRGLLGV